MDPLGVYYFPTDIENNLIMTSNKSLNEFDVCLNIEYLLTKEKDIKLNIQYTIGGEDTTESILQIRPKLGAKETTALCLRDLIASTAQHYYLSLNSVQNEYKGLSNRLHIRFEAISTPDAPWKFFETTQTFLKTDLTLLPDQFKQIVPENVSNNTQFTQNENIITFSG